ncbi:serine/threonine protein phosphatase [Roseibacillus persicicus]|uniref:Serine/threonine protein phosphatase n=2 Tax=Roseibacillus persicicus TaxID=454148 RepID=A0A918WNG3_9BACT|nr:serine/threonine protein phosphatase [Roseibacillus persicicus]
MSDHRVLALPMMPRLLVFSLLFATSLLPSPGQVLAKTDAPSRPSEKSWTIAIIPDTQYYVRDREDAKLFTELTKWLTDNQQTYNIRLALHVGDIVDANDEDQWKRAKSSLSLFDGKMPYILAVGNHDLGKNSSDRSTLLNDYFSLRDNPLNEEIFGGSFEEGRLENAYYHFQHGDRDYLIFSLEFGPRKEVVAWANQVASQHRDQSFILLTHEFIDQESTLFSEDQRPRHTTPTTKNSPYSYGIAKEGNVHCGEELWEALVSKHSNFEFVFNGHYKAFRKVDSHSDEVEMVRELAATHRSDNYPDGRKVHQMLFNAQWAPRGGEGWVRLLEFLPDGKTVKAWTVSPYLARTAGDPASAWATGSNLQFTLTLPPPMGQ